MGSGSSKLSAEEAAGIHVVVVGGGYGGMECAIALRNANVNFTLVDPKEFFHHNIGALRAAVFPEFAKNTAIPFAATFGDRFLQATVTEIDLQSKKVALESDGPDYFRKILAYTHLVVATGSKGAYPARTRATDAKGVFKEAETMAAEIKKSKNVVIIGGGPVGIELAGEIKDGDETTSVTILQSGDTLLFGVNLGERLQEDVKSLLEWREVVVKLGERVSNMAELTFDKHLEQTVKTDKGGSYEADIVFNCTGLRPNTDLTKDTFEMSLFDEHDRLKVTSDLRVEGFKDVFAIGDSCNTKEEKMAAHAGAHADLVAENIVRAVKGKETKTYEPRFEGMIVPVGRKYGAGVINGWHLPAFIWGCLKGKNLFVGQYWRAMGQQAPD